MLKEVVWVICSYHSAKICLAYAGALPTSCQCIINTEILLWFHNPWNWSKLKHWNCISHAMMFLWCSWWFCQQALERVWYIKCFVWQSYPWTRMWTCYLVILLLNITFKEQLSCEIILLFVWSRTIAQCMAVIFQWNSVNRISKFVEITEQRYIAARIFWMRQTRH